MEDLPPHPPLAPPYIKVCVPLVPPSASLSPQAEALRNRRSKRLDLDAICARGQASPPPPPPALSDASPAHRWTWYGARCSIAILLLLTTAAVIIPIIIITIITTTLLLLLLFSTTMSSSSRKISSESFSSSVGSDCGLESPGGDGGGGGPELAEENRGCPFSSLPSSQRALLWNGRSSAERSACAAGEEQQQQQQGPFIPHKRVTRRRRVNLDSLGESLKRLTSPTVSGTHAESWTLQPPDMSALLNI